MQKKSAFNLKKMIELFERVKRETHVLVQKFDKTRVQKDNPLGLELEVSASLSLLIKQQKITENQIDLIKRAYFPEYLLDSIDQAYVQIKYEGYIDRQQKQVKKMNQLEAKRIPLNFNYNNIASLSNEGREKTDQIQTGNHRPG